MRQAQRGSISLFRVALFSAAFAAVAMAALFSMRYERNLFAEGWRKLSGAAGMSAVAGAAAPAPGAGVLRKCVLNGKTVFSDVACAADDPRSTLVKVQRTRGIEAPKAPPAPPADASPATLREKMLEKASR
ncbi:DUF4124 domain-containing protein [Janthinobacterium sp.]|uniref:DUF4124 domain-containing protein n=1 Tax=Janthinobacterium sp. TaxID=1871054 RepID=UPI00293D25AD|nr:DUF4124 domain-containing protein [Janthinobacterium sp.]